MEPTQETIDTLRENVAKDFDGLAELGIYSASYAQRVRNKEFDSIIEECWTASTVELTELISSNIEFYK